MKIVIDIPDERYKKFTEYDGFMCYAEQLIKNGTPLPKGHGDLIDRNAIEILRIENINREYDKGFDAGVSCMVNRILEAPTIIEADNGGEE